MKKETRQMLIEKFFALLKENNIEEKDFTKIASAIYCKTRKNKMDVKPINNENEVKQ